MQVLSGTKLCAATHLARRLGEFAALTVDELSVLRDLTSDVRSVSRRQDIIQERKTSRDLFFVLDGLLTRYRILRDGRRQIVNVVIPGDVAGVPGCFFDGALYSVRTLTPSVVAVTPLSRLYGLFETHPLLAAKIFWLFSCEMAVYAERVVVLGRRSALERIAHFFLELFIRLEGIGLAEVDSFSIPLSQEAIADALGLSVAYVNRVLRQLADEGLVVIKDHRVVISDIAALTALADFEQGYLRPTPISAYVDAA